MNASFWKLAHVAMILALVSHGCDCGTGAGSGDEGDGGDELDASNDAGDGDGESPPRPDVHVVITADNAYGFGYGGVGALNRYFEGVEDGGDHIFVCSDACDDETPCPDIEGEPIECDPFGTCNDDRWGPETYLVPGEDTAAGDYLYIVTWSDERVTQGLIAQFKAENASSAVYTGQSDQWRVCATGENYDPPSGGPSLATIDEYIAKCNMGAGGGTFSNGWVGADGNADGQALAVLDPADEAGHDFDILCGRDPSESHLGDAIDDPARWIWFDDDVSDGLSAFESPSDPEHPKYDDPRGDFLIFRLPLFVVLAPG